MSTRHVDQRLAFVALGANLGDATTTLLRVFDRLQTFSTAPLLRSSLWKSEPVGCPPGSPSFVNAVAGLLPSPELTPLALLGRLQELEQEFGRRRTGIVNEPRTVDLDLLTFGTAIVSSPRLNLPHPRAHLRRFVLEPLAEIAPNLVLPGQTLSMHELLRRLPAGQVVEKLPSTALPQE